MGVNPALDRLGSRRPIVADFTDSGVIQACCNIRRIINPLGNMGANADGIEKIGSLQRWNLGLDTES